MEMSKFKYLQAKKKGRCVSIHFCSRINSRRDRSLHYKQSGGSGLRKQKRKRLEAALFREVEVEAEAVMKELMEAKAEEVKKKSMEAEVEAIKNCRFQTL